MKDRVVGAILRGWLTVRTRGSSRWCRDERGDVPGWVMIVVMTAALVSGLWIAAEDQLKTMLDNALSSVTDN